MHRTPLKHASIHIREHYVGDPSMAWSDPLGAECAAYLMHTTDPVAQAPAMSSSTGTRCQQTGAWQTANWCTHHTSELPALLLFWIVFMTIQRGQLHRGFNPVGVLLLPLCLLTAASVPHPAHKPPADRPKC